MTIQEWLRILTEARTGLSRHDLTIEAITI